MVETNTGYVEFASRAVRDKVLQQIESKSLTCTVGGKTVEVKRARAKSATLRNAALKKAAAELEKTVPKEDVDIVWTGSRGVTVRGVYAFDQPNGDTTGKLCGDFEHLDLDL